MKSEPEVAVRADPGFTQGRWTNTDALIAALLALAAALICAAAILRRPDLNSASTFLFADPGTNLLIADRLSEGARLYRDIGFSYGPLAIHPYAWFTRAFGNTPQAFSSFLAMFSVVNVILAYRLLRRHVSRPSAVLIVVGGLYATLLLPGSLIFGIQASTYFVLERVLFLTLLLSWRPPSERQPRHAVVIGLLLGVWQGLRFGTALFLGAAILVVDVLALCVASADRTSVSRWIRLSLATLGCFLAIEAAWAVYAYAVLPAADASDFLWPSYVLDAFDVWPTERRWPRFENIRLLIGQQLLPIGSAALGMIVVAWTLRSRRRAVPDRSAPPARIGPADLALLIPLAFYSIGAAGLFRSVYHFHQYAWTLPLVAALAVERGGRRFALAFLLVSLPGLALMLRANLITRPPADSVAVRPPRGGQLTVSPREKQRIDALRDYATVPVARSLLVMRTGAGFHALFGTRFSGRQSFYILGFARGDDENTMLRTLQSGASAIVLTDYPIGETPAADPCTWYGWRHFTPDFCPKLSQHVDIAAAIQVDDATWIIPSVAAGDRGTRSSGGDPDFQRPARPRD